MLFAAASESAVAIEPPRCIRDKAHSLSRCVGCDRWLRVRLCSRAHTHPIGSRPAHPPSHRVGCNLFARKCSTRVSYLFANCTHAHTHTETKQSTQLCVSVAQAIIGVAPERTCATAATEPSSSRRRLRCTHSPLNWLQFGSFCVRASSCAHDSNQSERALISFITSAARSFTCAIEPVSCRPSERASGSL